jgi:hypothetical protein
MRRTLARRGGLTIKRALRSAASRRVRFASALLVRPATRTGACLRAARLTALATALSLIGPSLTSASDACPEDQIRASGAPERTIFSRQASVGIRAEWCEVYDASGRSTRVGAYIERYPTGLLRLEASYQGARLRGPVIAYHENGEVFLRGTLDDGEWSGAFSLYHENGGTWIAADFDGGLLNGPVTTLYPDGSRASETTFQRGQEDGLARNFYPTALGGGLRSETFVESDEVAGIRKRYAPSGEMLADPIASAPNAAPMTFQLESAEVTPKISALPKASAGESETIHDNVSEPE